MTARSIYHYRSASRFLLDRVLELQKANRHFSIRKWAREMGFPSHSLLAMVLQGKRSLTLKQVPYFAKGMSLSTPEKLFFQGLIQVENARTPEEKEWCEVWLSELRPGSANAGAIREIDQYLTIADWIHPALLALSDTRTSFSDAESVAAKLPSSASTLEIRAAIERLMSLTLLKKDAAGVYRATTHRMTTKDDVANRGASEYHRQSAALAAERVQNLPVSEREFQSLAIAIPSSRLALAKEMLRKFRTQFSEAMDSEHADQVYQLNLHFFRLTEHPSEPVSVLKANEGADLFPAISAFSPNEGVPS